MAKIIGFNLLIFMSLSLLPFACSFMDGHPGKDQTRYVWRYQTISHQLLKIDEEISSYPQADRSRLFDKKYALLDDFIDSVKLALAEVNKMKFLSATERAITTLRIVDEVLTRLNFIVCIGTKDLAHGLTPVKIPPGCQMYVVPDNIDHSAEEFYFSSCFTTQLQIRLTKSGLEHLNKNRDEDYYLIDCDISALLFLSIAEVNNLPIHMIEIPEHNFVRWRIDERDYINWDNNTARVYADYDFRNGLTATSKTKITAEEETNGHFMQDMTQDQIKGYYITLAAETLKEGKKFLQAESYYREAIKYRPYSSLALNNLSWMYLTVADFKSEKNYQEALRLSKIVDGLSPNDLNYRDTYGCACAAVGDFAKAIELERSAQNDSDQIKGYMNKKTCLDMGLQ
jgi:tetratricopeptide (TPR) repeat protein